MTAAGKKLKFVRCKNCNKIEYLSRSNLDGFCSPECRNIYTRCTTCGRYFILKKNQSDEEQNVDDDKTFKKKSCSDECKIIYILHKK
jgi:hypothetical protein